MFQKYYPVISAIKSPFVTIYTWVRKRDDARIIQNYQEYLPVQDLDGDNRSVKKALLSYLVVHLLPTPENRDTSTFSNAGIAQYLPRALNELGYSVDIINFNNRNFVPDKKYDLFIGHGGFNFEILSKKLDPSCIKIYFSTGTYWKEWNRVEQIRLDALWERRKVTLPPDRIIDNDEEFANVNADGIICLGNDHARQTYSRFPVVINVNNAVYPDTYTPAHKNFDLGRKNFLFFNGGGNVHKGLDLMLEVFIQTDHHLYVRQDIEPAFFKVYKKELTEYPNIHLVPYLKKPSNDFSSLMDTCNFVISPTCAEGQPGSVIECMAHGLIPILSREANIDTRDFGITLRENSVDEILSVVTDISRKTAEWYQNKSSLTIEEVKKYYMPEHFLENMKKAINIVVKSGKKQ
jgi:hypothetical protein